MIVEIPEYMFGEIQQPWGKTQFEPNVEPGIIISGHKNLCAYFKFTEAQDQGEKASDYCLSSY